MTLFSHGGRRHIMKKTNVEYMDTQVKCSCGNEFVVKSTTNDLLVEVCDKCHPFYTGKQGAVSKTGNVEKFNRRYNLKNEKEDN